MRMTHALNRVLMSTLLMAMTACAAKAIEKPIDVAPAETGAGTLAAARQFLEGRWALESFEMRPPGKAPIALNGSGTLVYDEFSNLKMEIRADKASTDLLRAAGIDIRNGVISTDGRTAVDMQNRTLTYVLSGQTAKAAPGPLDVSRPRHWEVQGDVLILTTQDDAGSPLSVSRWKRSP
jgi:hypothetical protein